MLCPVSLGFQGGWFVAHEGISLFPVSSECYNIRPSVLQQGKKGSAATATCMHTSLGSSTLPGRQPSELPRCPTSPFPSLSPCTQREALWLLFCKARSEEREGGGLPEKAAAELPLLMADNSVGRSSQPLCVGLGPAKTRRREAVAVSHCRSSF